MVYALNGNPEESLSLCLKAIYPTISGILQSQNVRKSKETLAIRASYSIMSFILGSYFMGSVSLWVPLYFYT